MPESTSPDRWQVDVPVDFRPVERRDKMVGPRNPKDLDKDPGKRPGATRRSAVGLILGAPLLGACSGDIARSFGSFSNPFSSQPAPGPAGPTQQPLAVGNGQVK